MSLNLVTEVRIGISGWRYAPWRGTFYPKGLTQARELEYASARMNSIEINGSFYALQRPEHYRRWAEQTPDDFRFSLKGPRFITHLKKLSDVETPLANFFASGPLALGPKLGPVLWQLPPTLGFDAGRMNDFLGRLPRSTAAAAELAQGHDERLDGRALTVTDADRPLRHAVEVRHPSFATAPFVELLRGQQVALVVADTAKRFPFLDDVTADFVYVRLHGDEELYVSGYGDEALDGWAARIRKWSADRDVYVYFDNDVKTRAPYDAMALAERVRSGYGPTSNPEPSASSTSDGE